MDPEFWVTAWEEGRTAFHQDDVHPDLPANQDWLLDGGPRRVLVPLCGKTVDLAWFADLGHEAVGVELAPKAVRALFAGVGPSVDRVGPFVRHAIERLTVLQGDWFDLRPEHVGTFDRIWDRAALVAMRPDQRAAYVAVEQALLAPGGRVLLNTFSYDQGKMQGPPFSTPKDVVRELWKGWTVDKVHEEVNDGGRFRERGLDSFRTTTWRISR